MKKIITCLALLGTISIAASGQDGRKSPLQDMQKYLLGGKVGRPQQKRKRRPGLGLRIATSGLGSVAEAAEAQRKVIAVHSAKQEEGEVAKRARSAAKDRSSVKEYFERLTSRQDGGARSATSVLGFPVEIKQEKFTTQEAAVRNHHQQCNWLKNDSMSGINLALLITTWEELGKSYYRRIQGKGIDTHEEAFWNEMVALKSQFNNDEVESVVKGLVGLAAAAASVKVEGK